MTIVIVPTGTANIGSVCSALNHLGIRAALARSPEALSTARGLVVPGVGAFGAAMSQLMASGMNQALLDEAKKGKAILGICLGMQLFADWGQEFGIWQGLGVIRGRIREINRPELPSIQVPRVGWFDVRHQGRGLFAGIETTASFYFSHSYELTGYLDSDVSGWVDADGRRIVASIERDNLMGTQFHPEKSGPVGLNVLRNFVHST